LDFRTPKEFMVVPGGTTMVRTSGGTTRPSLGKVAGAGKPPYSEREYGKINEKMTVGVRNFQLELAGSLQLVEAYYFPEIV
jgi:hypothetical protein